MSATGPIPFALVVLLCAAAAVVPLARWHWQRRELPPVTEKRLRQPGERLRQRLTLLEDRLPWWLLGALALPPLFVAGLSAFLPVLTDARVGTGLLVSGYLLAALALGLGVWMLVRTQRERRDLRRALNGEIVVAEYLQSLVPHGYRVFHDVPTEARTTDETLHHVVIGPAGVFSIFTQTHAQKRALPGRKEHEILFDGDQLVYPWGQDTQGIVPARKRAEWLSDWLFQIVGERIPVAPVLTFPGWWVTPMTQRDVRVYNPGQLAALIQGSAAARLSESQAALILRQLEDRCRDVLR